MKRIVQWAKEYVEFEVDYYRNHGWAGVRYMLWERINWRNIPARLWLWRHDSHAHRDLTGTVAGLGDVWLCSCGSTYVRRNR